MINYFQDLGINKVVYATYFDEEAEVAQHALARIVPYMYELAEGEWCVQYLGMNEGEKLPPGEPSLEMYLKLAECFMRKGKFDEALYNIGEAADFNPESTVRNRVDLCKDINKY